jgi:hypothetical protein
MHDEERVDREVQDSLEEDVNAQCESILLVTDDVPGEDHKVGVKDFKIAKVVGRGSFGKVMLVKKIDTGKPFHD